MSFKQFRHSVGRLLGIRRYVFMAEPEKTLDLDALLGPSPAAPRREDVRAALLREFAVSHRPRGVVHCGACSADDLAWYAAAGFGHVLVVSVGAEAVPTTPAGLTVRRAEIGAVAALRIAAVPSRAWTEVLANHAFEPADFTFFNFAEPGWPPAEIPSFVQAVCRCFRPDGADRLRSAMARGQGFADHGLNLALVGASATAGTVEAGYLRRPVVTMSDFGRNGRFGNQLFQRVYLRLVARRQGAVLQLPLWAGTALFGAEDPPPAVRPRPVLREETLDLESRRRLCSQPEAGFDGLDFSGYGMVPTRWLAEHKEQIRADHRFDVRLTDRFDRIVRPLLAGGKKLVVIHLRRGDYGYAHFFRAPCRWYQEWVTQQGFTPESHVLYVCSEDPVRYRDRFPGFTVVTADDLGTPGSLAPYFDFLAMTQADALAIANSSFSFFAAMLNVKAERFVRPDALPGALVPFDPWDAEPLLDQKLSPEEHQRLREID